MPSASAGGTEPRPGLHDDVQALERHLNTIEGPVILVGHGYGGSVITEVGGCSASKISQLLYLAAYLPELGESVFAMHDAPAPDDVRGVILVPDDAAGTFYDDVDSDAAAWAVDQLVPQTVRSWSEGVTDVGTRSAPSSYVLCERDQALAPSMQEKFALRAGSLHRLDSGHSPFLSMPMELARVLVQLFSGADEPQSLLPEDPA
jgi:pimeloyl-ACP methyl ester carboxylesterase